MKIDEKKYRLVLAERQLSTAALARKCSISRTWLYSVLKSDSILPKTAGKIANGLGVPVTEIIQDQ